jgi:RNA polymerase sigma factor (TIGR02999 family)
MSEITRLMAAVERGESRAAEELLPVVYNELRRLAACRLAQEKPGQTLQATALVHEAWLRLAEPTGQGWKSKAHFFGAAAEAMRRILVDNARRKQAQKRGGAAERVNVDEVDIAWRPCLTNGSWPWTRRWTGCSWRIRRQRNW